MVFIILWKINHWHLKFINIIFYESQFHINRIILTYNHITHQIQNFYSPDGTLNGNESCKNHLRKSNTIHGLFLSNLYFENWSCIFAFYSSNKLPNEFHLFFCWFWLSKIVLILMFLRKQHPTKRTHCNHQKVMFL